MENALEGKVIVITGASSGIGRLTALRCANHGAKLALVSRNEAALNELAQHITAQGAEAIAVPVDISQRTAVDSLVGQVMERYGRIDVLINAAAVSLYGTVADVPVEEMEHVIQTNLLGTIYTTKAVLPVLLAQGTGHIINIGSVLSRRSISLQSAYSASKFGVKGFTDALRMELMAHAPGIQVTLVLPASINTPFFSHARSRMGVRPMPVPPVYEPDVVADAILQAIAQPQRSVYAGDAGILMTMMENLMPGLTDRLMVMGRSAEEMQKTEEPTTAMDDSFYLARGDSGRVYGDFGALTVPARFTPIWQRIRPYAGLATMASLGLAFLVLKRR